MWNWSIEPATPETEEMLIAPVPAVYNENVPTKNMVPDPEWLMETEQSSKTSGEKSDYSSRVTE